MKSTNFIFTLHCEIFSTAQEYLNYLKMYSSFRILRSLMPFESKFTNMMNGHKLYFNFNFNLILSTSHKYCLAFSNSPSLEILLNLWFL